MKSSFWQREPALITSQVTALLGLLAAGGLALNDAQTAAIVGAAVALATVIAGFVVRSKVSSPATVAKLPTAAAVGTSAPPSRDLVTVTPDPDPAALTKVLASVDPVDLTGVAGLAEPVGEPKRDKNGRFAK